MDASSAVLNRPRDLLFPAIDIRRSIESNAGPLFKIRARLLMGVDLMGIVSGLPNVFGRWFAL